MNITKKAGCIVLDVNNKTIALTIISFLIYSPFLYKILYYFIQI